MLKDFEKEIIGQALAEIRSKKDIIKVVNKVKSTFISKEALIKFMRLVEFKSKILREV